MRNVAAEDDFAPRCFFSLRLSAAAAAAAAPNYPLKYFPLLNLNHMSEATKIRPATYRTRAHTDCRICTHTV